MATLKKVFHRVAEIGGKITSDNYGNINTIRIEAPHGMVWAGSGVHELVDSAFKPWNPDYKNLLERMSHGLEPCPAGAACEWCHSEEESK